MSTIGALLLAVVVGYVVGREVTLARWNAERRRFRKLLGVATIEDYQHRD